MTETAGMEIYVVLNSRGEYEVGVSEVEALERFDDQVGGFDHRRVYQLNLTAPLPKAIEVAATLPQMQDGGYSLEIKP